MEVGLEREAGTAHRPLLVEVDVAYRLAGDSVDASFALERLVNDQSAFQTSTTSAIQNAANAAASQAQLAPNRIDGA